MTRTEFFKKYCLKAAVVLAMLAVLVYLFSHALGLTKSSLHTTPVRMISDRRITSATAYLFRDERVLYANARGLVDPLAPNGSKVGKNVAVARFYPKNATEEEIATLQNAIDKENRYIEILEKSVSVAKEPVSHANGYREQANLEYMELRNAIAGGRFFDLATMEEDFLIQLNRYMLLSGKDATLSEVLTTVREEKNARLGSEYTEIKNEDDEEERTSGTFYDRSFVDGYESVFSAARLSELTLEEFDEMKASPAKLQSGTVVGKMIYGYSWHLAMNLKPETALLFEEGRSYTLTFPENADAAITFSLERRVDGESASLLIFSTSDTPAGFDYHRVQNVEITVDHVDGYYVPESALVMERTERGEEEGVYVFENSLIRFRRIEVLYRGDGYCIVLPPELSEITELTDNDILVTSGKNLYDGKGY